jgi:hypothetical protein
MKTRRQAQHRRTYTWRGYLAHLISLIVRPLASLQGTLLQKDVRRK